MLADIQRVRFGRDWILFHREPDVEPLRENAELNKPAPPNKSTTSISICLSHSERHLFTFPTYP